MKLFRNILSLFLVLGLTGPGFVKLVHDLSHNHDEVCNEYVEQHFHQQEHKCHICDYSLGNGIPSVNFSTGIIDFIFISKNDHVPVLHIPVFHFGVSGLRAPPVFA